MRLVAAFPTSGVLQSSCVRRIATLLAAAILLTLDLRAAIAPSFRPAGNLAYGRRGHSATPLQDGRVLLYGGYLSPTTVSQTFEIYDPSTGSVVDSWNSYPPRQYHTATALPNGRVLVAGGHSGSTILKSTTLVDFDVLGREIASSDMNTARYGHIAIVLQNGKVLIAGGLTTGGGATASCEIYNPADGSFTPTGNLNVARHNPTAALLANGKVLITGGTQPYGPSPFASAELYDPSTGVWQTLPDMGIARYWHTMTTLTDGRVLILGGETGGGPTGLVELFDPSTNTFSSPGSTTARSSHTATLLPDGRVVVIGGHAGYGCCPSVTAQLFDPSDNSFTATGNNMEAPRWQHTATLLPDGQVVVIGGYSDTSTWPLRIEVFDPADPTVTATDAMTTARSSHTSTLLPNGKVLVTGSLNGSNTAELYNPSTATWSNTGNMAVARGQHTATLLADGTVLIAGGKNSGGTLASAELYNPAAGTFSTTGGMTTPRHSHTATLLRDGRVLITGGGDGGGVATAEVYDPSTRKFTATANSMSAVRTDHTATLLNGGNVLIAGNGSADVFSADYGTFSPTTGSMLESRTDHQATLLPNGNVLITGGGGSATAEIYDTGSNTFLTAPSMTFGRGGHTATLLTSGKVLIAGGQGDPEAPGSWEFYDPQTARFTYSGSLVPERSNHRATLLPSGEVLLTGAAPSSTSTVLLDPGLGFTEGRRSVLTSLPARLCQAGTLSLTGSAFFGTSEGSSGGFQNSAANLPLLRLQRIDNDFVYFAVPQSSSATSFLSRDNFGLPLGHYRVSIFNSGIPSVAKLLEITSSETPILYDYSSASGTNATSRTVTPSNPPVYKGTTATATATVSAGYTGTVSFNRSTGAVTLTNIGPVGNYTVTVRITTTCGEMAQKTFTLTVTPIAKPVNVVATATSTSSVTVTWSAVTGANHYEVERESGSGYEIVGTPSTPSFTNNGLTPTHAYVYRVTAVDNSGAKSVVSNPDLATTVLFADDPLVAHTTLIRAVHITQLQNAANAVRVTSGLAPYSFFPVAVGDVVRDLDVGHIFSILSDARSRLGLSPISQTFNSTVRAADVTLLRNGVK